MKSMIHKAKQKVQTDIIMTLKNTLMRPLYRRSGVGKAEGSDKNISGSSGKRFEPRSTFAATQCDIIREGAETTHPHKLRHLSVHFF